jgi:ATP dependent DNA ligase domain
MSRRCVIYLTAHVLKLKLTSLPQKSAAFIEPMECLAVAKLPDGAQWLYEIKLDGYRAEAMRSDSGVILFSRSRKSFNKQFSLIVEALAGLPENTVIDGEVVALDELGRRLLAGSPFARGNTGPRGPQRSRFDLLRLARSAFRKCKPLRNGTVSGRNDEGKILWRQVRAGFRRSRVYAD